MSTPPTGRRERKKAATRQAIADAALHLFLEHGYDHVSIRDIAEAADVSTATIFKHFTGKEALVFDQDESREAELVAVVRQRPEGQSILDALRRHVHDSRERLAAHPQMAEFEHLVDSTPALHTYAEHMWTRHTASLAAAIAEETGADDVSCTALAKFVLEIPAITRGRSDQRAAAETIFAILEYGWQPPPNAK